jgi:hypothetical protein
MKKLKFLILSITFSTWLNGQVLNFEDLIFSYQNNVGTVTDFINQKGFSFSETTREDGQEGMVWKYDRTSENNILLFFAKFCYNSNCGGIHIQTDSKDLFFNLKKQALKYGFKYETSKVSEYENEDGISSTYYYKDFSLIMSEGKTNSGRTTYTITLIK